MKNEEIIKMLNEGLSLEEIPTISNLEELKGLIEQSNLDNSIKLNLNKRLNCLIKDTLNHAKIITNLIQEIENK